MVAARVCIRCARPDGVGRLGRVGHLSANFILTSILWCESFIRTVWEGWFNGWCVDGIGDLGRWRDGNADCVIIIIDWANYLDFYGMLARCWPCVTDEVGGEGIRLVRLRH